MKNQKKLWVKNGFRQSMAFYRGKGFQGQDNELQSIIELEVDKQSSGIPKPGFMGRLRILKTPAFLKPLKCVGVIMILMNLSGIYIIFSFSAIFLEAGHYISKVGSCYYEILIYFHNLGSGWKKH